MNKKGQQTREHIKQSAYPLFAEKGFKQVTMKDICEAANLSRGGLYGHYESTRQIFQEMVEDMVGRQEDEVNGRIGQNEPAVSILGSILEKYQEEMIDSQSSLSTAIYEYFSMQDIAGQKNLLYKQYEKSVHTWKTLIQYGVARQEFYDVEAGPVVDLILFSYQGVRMYSKLMPVDKGIPAGIVRQVKKILVRG